MKILITGNMGYVGSVLVKHLKQQNSDIEIIGFDTGYFAHCLTNADFLPEKNVSKQYFGDLRSFDEKILNGIDSVVHLAAISNDPIGNEFSEVTDIINYRSTIQLAELSIKHGVKNFVYASSCSIYGSAEGGAKKETDSLNPLTAYAHSKGNSEKGLSEIESKNMCITSLRFSTACGMSDRLRLDLVLNDFVASALLTKNITVLSDGSPWRPLINVKDMALAIEWASKRSIENGGKILSVNVGSDIWNYQVKDLAKAVANRINGTEININKDALPDKRSYRVDFTLYNSLATGFLPKVSLNDTIDELIEGINNTFIENVEFRNSNFIRFNVLKRLISNNILSKELFWLK
jgi:nucleoside-diphosphate-sugar epimerase